MSIGIPVSPITLRIDYTIVESGHRNRSLPAPQAGTVAAVHHRVSNPVPEGVEPLTIRSSRAIPTHFR